MANSWGDDCAAEIAAALAALGNASPTDGFNPYRRALEVDIIPHQLSLEVLYNGEWHEQRDYLYESGLPRGKERSNFEISTMTYTVQDVFEPSAITFKGGAPAGAKVRLKWGNEWLFKGEIESPPLRLAHHTYTVGDRCRYQVTCVNEMNLLKRGPMFEIIEGGFEGGMLIYLFAKYCPELNTSGINPNFGQAIEKRLIAGQNLYDVVNEVLKNNPGSGAYLEIATDPSTVYLDARSSLPLLLDGELTDRNLYGDGSEAYPGFCSPGDWRLSPTDRGYRNQVTIEAPLLINTGLADFEQGTNVVLGHNNEAGWAGKVFHGMRIRKVGSPSTYTVDEDLSSPPDPDPPGQIDDLRIQGEYKEEDATGAPYEIVGNNVSVTAEDWNEIERRKLLRQESGELAGVRGAFITLTTPLTLDELERLAEQMLRLNTYEGFFKTCSRRWLVSGIRAGKSLRHSMADRDVVADIPITEVDWVVDLGLTTPLAGQERARVLWNLSFDNRDFVNENVLLSMMLRDRRGKITAAEGSSLLRYRSIAERTLSLDCAFATQGEAVIETSSASDTAAAENIGAVVGPFYPSPLGPGQQGMDPWDLDDGSACWYPS